MDGGKSKKVMKKGTTMMKKGVVKKSRGKMSGRSIKRGRAKVTEKGGIRMRQSKADSGKMNEDTEIADKASSSHLEPDKKREKVKLPKHKINACLHIIIMYIS